MNRTISLVIPVYNEANYLGACLESIAAQTVTPLQVIVVDNNSTDRSAAIADRYAFVTVLHEPRQGVVFARNTGFTAAKADIIGRIDADTVLPPHWVEHVLRAFKRQSVSALSGAVEYNDVIGATLINRSDLGYRRRIAAAAKTGMFLQGCNMAIRRSVWLEVQSLLCTNPAYHEDIDLTTHLMERHKKIIFEPLAVAAISARRVDNSWRSFRNYTRAGVATYQAHHIRPASSFYVFMWAVGGSYPLVRLLHRGYVKGNFSIMKALFSPSTRRVDPR